MPTKIGSATVNGTALNTLSYVSSATQSFAVGAGSNRCLVVGISCFPPNTAAAHDRTVTWNGVSMTRLGVRTYNGTSNTITAEIWYLSDAGGLSTATANIVITCTGQNQSLWFGAQTWGGVNQTTPMSDFTGASGAGSAPSFSVTTVAGDEAIDVLGLYCDAIPAITAGQTLTWKLEATDPFGFTEGQESATASGTSTTLAWSGTDWSGGWWRAGGALKQASTDITLGITSSGATAAIGTVAPTFAKGLTASAATGARGTVIPTRTKGLTSSAAAASRGTVAPVFSKGVTSTAATSAIGTVTPATGLTLPITGVGATGAVQTLAPTFDKGVSAAAATAAVNTVVPSNAQAASASGAASAVGTVVYDRTIGITAGPATGAVNTVVPARSLGVSGTQGSTAIADLGTSEGNTDALTGVLASTVVGSLPYSAVKAITGNVGTGSVGSVKPVFSFTALGVSATGAAGFVGAGSDLILAITGVGASTAVGSVTPGRSIAAAGVGSSGVAGDTAGARTLVLAGSAGTGQAGTVTPGTGVVLAITGVQANTALGTVKANTTRAALGVAAAANVGSLYAISLTVGPNPDVSFVPAEAALNVTTSPHLGAVPSKTNETSVLATKLSAIVK